MKLARLLFGTLFPLLLGGCACPPLSSSYGAPLATLESWQSHLCRDDAQGEWRCLSEELQRSMGGFATYVGARRQLLENDATSAWLLGRADLADYIVSETTDPRARRAELTLEARGQHFEVRFVQETAARIDLDDGRFLFAILDGPLSAVVQQQLLGGRVTRQWIELTRPRLDPDELTRIKTVHLEHRWKIDAISGLQPQTEIEP